jgi:hypothetical protein
VFESKNCISSGAAACFSCAAVTFIVYVGKNEIITYNFTCQQSGSKDLSHLSTCNMNISFYFDSLVSNANELKNMQLSRSIH